MLDYTMSKSYFERLKKEGLIDENGNIIPDKNLLFSKPSNNPKNSERDFIMDIFFIDEKFTNDFKKFFLTLPLDKDNVKPKS